MTVWECHGRPQVRTLQWHRCPWCVHFWSVLPFHHHQMNRIVSRLAHENYTIVFLLNVSKQMCHDWEKAVPHQGQTPSPRGPFNKAFPLWMSFNPAVLRTFGDFTALDVSNGIDQEFCIGHIGQNSVTIVLASEAWSRLISLNMQTPVRSSLDGVWVLSQY